MIVYGVDVSATRVSIARFDSTTDVPRVRVIRAPDVPLMHTPKTADTRIRALAGGATAALTQGGTPDLVVMVRFTWQTMRADTSAYRRAGVHRDIVRDLCAADVPVADVPMLTIQEWAGTIAKLGAGYLDALESDVRQRYTTVTDPGDRALVSVAAAATGAMALGLKTRWGTTQRRLDVLNHRSSGFGIEKQVGPQWPSGVNPPTSVGKPQQ